MRFLADANILIYTRDLKAESKRQVATEWLTALARREMLLTNLQVLNEVCHVALRKLRHLTSEDVRSWAADLSQFGDDPLDADVVEGAWTVRDSYRFSWFDCLILSSADRLGCTHVLTEDMGAPRQVGSLTLINPFVAGPGDVLSSS